MNTQKAMDKGTSDRRMAYRLVSTCHYCWRNSQWSKGWSEWCSCIEKRDKGRAQMNRSHGKWQMFSMEIAGIDLLGLFWAQLLPAKLCYHNSLVFLLSNFQLLHLCPSFQSLFLCHCLASLNPLNLRFRGNYQYLSGEISPVFLVLLAI